MSTSAPAPLSQAWHPSDPSASTSTAHITGPAGEVVGGGAVGGPGLPDRPGEMGGQSAGYGAQPAYPYGQQQQPYSSYSSPYSRTGLSSYGSSLSSGYGGYNSTGLGGGYGGYGGYGGMGMGGGMGGMGMGGMGMGGMGMGGQDPNGYGFVGAAGPSFAILESLIGAFSSFSQLLESTYHTTHSTFHALSSLYSQLGGIQTYFGRILGAISLVRLFKYLLSLVRPGSRSLPGRLSVGDGSGWAEEWIGAGSAHPSQRVGPRRNETPRPSAKPLIFFLISAIGLPYLMTKLVGLLTRLQAEHEATRLASLGLPPAPAPGQPAAPIVFARTVHPFEPTAEGELGLKRDEIVAVLQSRDAAGREMGWWRGRRRDGVGGWFPGNYVEILKKKEIAAPPPPAGIGMADPAK